MPRKKTVPIDSARKEGKPMAAKKDDFTKVVITDAEGRKYTLEFNARVVKNMERNGFKIDTDYPYSMIEKLFVGAFQMHHRGMQTDKIMDIWKFQKGKDELLGILTKLYMKPIEELMDDEKGEDGETVENPTWETV